tara:strand:- start:648 stop:1754 length:1107 start_codon:yes stop_codon:yes gene_type:complete
MSEEIKETPSGELAQGDFKIKKKMKKLTTNKEVVKVNMAKKEEPKVEAKIEIPKVEETKVEESPIIEEIKVDDKKEEVEETKEVVEEIKQQVVENPQIQLPENIEKLVDFMKDTGGTVEDYVNLNRDYSKLSGEKLLKEYYNVSKPHLNSEEINFLMDDNFSWNEDDEDRAIKKKKLAYKEEIAKAKGFLQSSKDKYYEEIKLKSSISKEPSKADDFFNRYNEEQEVVKKRHEVFTNNTNKFFSDEFKGFEYNVGEKSFRYNVNDTSGVVKDQSDLNNFVGKFLDKKGEIKDYKKYHKALYTASNADQIAKHFYEQGKTDAIRDVSAKSKNMTNEVRATSSGEMFINGMKIKAISGVDSSKLRIKKHN